MKREGGRKNNAHPVGISKELQISTPAPALSAAGAEKINDVKNEREGSRRCKLCGTYRVCFTPNTTSQYGILQPHGMLLPNTHHTGL